MVVGTIHHHLFEEFVGEGGVAGSEIVVKVVNRKLEEYQSMMEQGEGGEEGWDDRCRVHLLAHTHLVVTFLLPAIITHPLAVVVMISTQKEISRTCSNLLLK